MICYAFQGKQDSHLVCLHGLWFYATYSAEMSYSSRGQLMLSMALNKRNESNPEILLAKDVLSEQRSFNSEEDDDSISSDEDEGAYLPVSDQENGHCDITLTSVYDNISTILNQCPDNIIRNDLIEYINTEDNVGDMNLLLSVENDIDFDVQGQSQQPPSEKRKRCITDDEKIKRNLEKYSILPPCDCQKKCTEKFPETVRAGINRTFNEFSFAERRLWLDSYIYETETKRTKIYSENEDPKRKFSLQFMLPSGTNKAVVCKKMFLATLGRKTDGFITEFRKRKRKHSTDSSSLAPFKDGRKNRANPHNKKDHAKIREHINSYQPSISHYSRKNAPNRRYLNPELSVKDMLENYNKKHLEMDQVSYTTYFSVFQQENIGFSRPSVDDCSICLSHDAHIEDDDHNNSTDCVDCENFKRHQIKYREAREEYQNKEETADTKVLVSDMQKVLVLPKLSSKDHVFVSRLVTFNQTFASKDENGKHFVVLWHEAIAGRTASDVASAYMKIIYHVGIPLHVVFWADNCSGQNKNWYLLTGFVQCVNTWGPETITLKFLEVGHTFMAADSVHGCIGKKLKRKLIYDFEDFVTLCKGSMRNIERVLLDIPSIFEFEKGVKARKPGSNDPPILCDIVEIQLRKGSASMYYKTSFKDSSYKESSFLKPRAFLRFNKHKCFPQPVTTRRGITTSKKDGIIKLFHQGVPSAKRQFWQDIPINESAVDLCSTRDVGENEDNE